MEKIIIGRRNISETNFSFKKLVIIFLVVMVITWLTEFRVNIGILMFAIFMCFGPMWMIFSSLGKAVDLDFKNPNVTIEIDENTFVYSNKSTHQIFCLDLSSMTHVRLSYIQRFVKMMPVVDLKLEFLMNDDSLYSISTQGIVSQKGDYLKAIEFLKQNGVIVYDPYQLCSILNGDSFEFQDALLKRLWQGEIK